MGDSFIKDQFPDRSHRHSADPKFPPTLQLLTHALPQDAISIARSTPLRYNLLLLSLPATLVEK